jgi:hypothetical protein
MRTIHLAISLDEDTSSEAIEKAIGIFNKLFYTREIEGYRLWISTKEDIDTNRGDILNFLAKKFKDHREM